ncbi:regulator of G-protein signaling 4-like isoform X2 [Homarus americanus]|uniref:regulator of G-protein signaling 4-like isoform X2 n=1 Tax=Homarus americanus TaxID=6706 RepID=UPI001C43DCD1|nr:regulator of G-protein signaling 4-like isoform X2 [Homarus americanus]XP_042230356.1 regulator of G-protein signaling 4-like isoform X2 [Homarus americanus]
MSSTGKTENTKSDGSKTEKDKNEKEKTDKAKKPEKKKLPTKVQLEKWTSSINALLSDPDGVEAFRNFLLELEADGEEGEFTKYIDFFIACEKYKARFKELEDTAKSIFEEYLAEAAHRSLLLQVGADKEVGGGSESVEIGDKLEEEGLEGVTLFDEAQQNIKKKLADGAYINFCLDIKKKLKL